MNHPRDDVDERDDQARDGVALHELHRAVHVAEHLRGSLQLVAAILCLLFGDCARPGRRIDRHLLAGHRVEAEPRAHFGNALRAFGNHDELDQGDDQKHHEANDDVSLDDEFTERVDDFACVSVGEDASGSWTH